MIINTEIKFKNLKNSDEFVKNSLYNLKSACAFIIAKKLENRFSNLDELSNEIMDSTIDKFKKSSSYKKILKTENKNINEYIYKKVKPKIIENLNSFYIERVNYNPNFLLHTDYGFEGNSILSMWLSSEDIINENDYIKKQLLEIYNSVTDKLKYKITGLNVITKDGQVFVKWLFDGNNDKDFNDKVEHIHNIID